MAISNFTPLGLLEQLCNECKLLWGICSEFYFRVDESLRQLAKSEPARYLDPIAAPRRTAGAGRAPMWTGYRLQHFYSLFVADEKVSHVVDEIDGEATSHSSQNEFGIVL
jgi:hypothetical protein